MGSTTNYALPYPEETTAPPDVAADMHSLASAADTAILGVASTVKPLDTVGTNITTSTPGDTKIAGASGKAADAGHRHAREAAAPVDGTAGTASLRTLGTGAQQAAAGNDSRLSNARTPTAHSHVESDVTSLVSDLAGKAATSHTHAEADVTSLTADLAAKAAASHTHAESDVTNLATDLAGKSARVGGATRAGNLSFSSGTETLIAGLNDMSFSAVTGHRYKVTYTLNGLNSAVSNTSVDLFVHDGGGVAPTTSSTVRYQTEASSAPAGQLWNMTGHFELTGLSAGQHRLGFGLMPTGSTTQLGIGTTTSPYISSVTIEDMG